MIRQNVKTPTTGDSSGDQNPPVDHISLSEPESGNTPSISYTVIPKTGDDTNLTMWLFLVGVSGTAVVLLFLVLKKKENEAGQEEG